MRRNYRYGGVLILFLALSVCISPMGNANESGTWGDAFHGRLNVDFDGVTNGSHEDVNLSQTLQIKVDPPNTDKLRVRGLLWTHEDLDSDEYSTSAMRDVNDASGADVRARLLHLYVEIDDLWGKSTLRIGRQRILEGIAYNRIDGLYFAQHHAQWHWYTYAGARASLYDDAHNDQVLGGGVSYSPAHTTLLRLDAYYGEEHRAGGDETYRGPIAALLNLNYPRRIKRDIHDTAIAFSAWQAFTPNITGYARYTWNNEASDEISLDFTAYCPNLDLTFETTYRYQFSAVGDRVNNLTNYYRVMGSYESYSDWLMAVHKPINEKVTLSLEADFHNTHSSNMLTSANRDYQRYAAILSADDIVQKLDTILALEWWNVGGGEGTWAVTGEISRTWNNLTLTLGADYERYKDRVTTYNSLPYAIQQLAIAISPVISQGFNPLVFIFDDYVVTMHEDIYSIYTEVDWEVTENQKLDARFTYEMDDGPESPYWRMQAGYTLQF